MHANHRLSAQARALNSVIVAAHGNAPFNPTELNYGQHALRELEDGKFIEYKSEGAMRHKGKLIIG